MGKHFSSFVSFHHNKPKKREREKKMWVFIQSWAGARISESEPALKNFYWAHKSIATQWTDFLCQNLKENKYK